MKVEHKAKATKRCMAVEFRDYLNSPKICKGFYKIKMWCDLWIGVHSKKTNKVALCLNDDKRHRY